MRKLVTLGLAAGVLLTGWAVAADPPKPAEVKPETSPSPAKVEKVEEKPAAEPLRTPLQMRFDVLELKLSQAEADRINKSEGVVDVAALAAEVVKRGDARVMYALGGPVVTNEKLKFESGQRVPFIRNKPAKDTEQVNATAVQFEKIGCTVEGVAQSSDDPGSKAVSVYLRVQLRDMVPESTVQVGPETPAPIFFERTQDFTARLAFGREAYFWELASIPQVCDYPGNLLVHVYRLRFDPEPAKPDAKR